MHAGIENKSPGRRIRVLVVDDSSFFRRRVKEILEADRNFEVIDTAADGQEAVTKTLRLSPDVVTMDVEMPVMDGISAVKAIITRRPATRIIMFSSLTQDGASVTLDSLEAGAADFFPKSFEEIAANRSDAIEVFRAKVLALAGKPAARGSAAVQTARRDAAEMPQLAKLSSGTKLALIAASTGGPVALQEVLSQLPARVSFPIVVVQHMPAAFTGTFAERLNRACRVEIKEARDGETAKPGSVYIAPGGQQLAVVRAGGVPILKVLAGTSAMSYKPCADFTFTALSQYSAADVLVIMLTGMGSDGCEGTRLLKQKGATVWAQDEATSVVFGMPGAVVKAGLADSVMPVSAIGASLCVAK
jgi:two-component system chemotaxis response regulator CheB